MLLSGHSQSFSNQVLAYACNRWHQRCRLWCYRRPESYLWWSAQKLASTSNFNQKMLKIFSMCTENVDCLMFHSLFIRYVFDRYRSVHDGCLYQVVVKVQFIIKHFKLRAISYSHKIDLQSFDFDFNFQKMNNIRFARTPDYPMCTLLSDLRESAEKASTPAKRNRQPTKPLHRTRKFWKSIFIKI